MLKDSDNSFRRIPFSTQNTRTVFGSKYLYSAEYMLINVQYCSKKTQLFCNFNNVYREENMCFSKTFSNYSLQAYLSFLV